MIATLRDTPDVPAIAVGLEEAAFDVAAEPEDLVQPDRLPSPGLQVRLQAVVRLC